MTYTITKEFTFSASHRLTGLPDGHQCTRLHGHNYTVQVCVSGSLDPTGFVIDYGDLAPVKMFIDRMLDHRHLNDVLPANVGNPTAEHVAAWLGSVVSDLVTLPPDASVSIGVSETPKTWAWWSP